MTIQLIVSDTKNFWIRRSEDIQILLYLRIKFVDMDFLNPAVTSGVNIFVNIVIFLAAFGAALSLIDFKREQEKKEE